jgi:hypothetical protein
MATGKHPTIAFCGHGRAGKDTAGRILWRKTPLVYSGSLSWAGLPYMAKVLNMCEQDAWDSRHTHRQRWKSELDRFRMDDPTRLIRMSLEKGNIVVGIRAKEELVAAKNLGLLDFAVWVHRAGVPEDPTVTYTWRDCDITLFNPVPWNDGSGAYDPAGEAEFGKVIDSMIDFLKIPTRSTELVAVV